MRKLLFVLTLTVFSLALSAGVALAGGDQNHGDKAAGDPAQTCVNFGTCPWE